MPPRIEETHDPITDLEARDTIAHLAIGLGVKAAHQGHRARFASATDWVARLGDAHHTGRLAAELKRLRRYRLLVVDEDGDIPFEPEAANLLFQLVFSPL